MNTYHRRIFLKIYPSLDKTLGKLFLGIDLGIDLGLDYMWGGHDPSVGGRRTNKYVWAVLY